MKLILDTAAATLTVEDGGQSRVLELYSKEAFEEISRQWLRVGWNQKYPYTFSWMGRPIIQMPEDMIRIQEVIYHLKPGLIVEAGIAHGGGLIFYSSLCKMIGKGRVVGIDIEIRPHNRAVIEAHELFDHITLIEGDSTAADTVLQVKSLVKSGEHVLVVLDSNHTYAHVHSELEAYADIVTPGSYIVVTDGIISDLADVPRGEAGWSTNNPVAAARDFARKRQEFVIEKPAWPFNESDLEQNITHWPAAWLKRVG